jgi:DNA-binding MarR family transcriptional regulator
VDNSGRPLADEVLSYLVQHPQAQDTMEGIVEWWLLERRIRYAIADVEAALRELVGKDFLVARQCSEGRTYYRLNREQEREIRRHLRSTQAAQETKPEPNKPES